MPNKVVTQKYKLHMARQILESISEVSNSVYYVFTSNHIPRETSGIPEINETMQSLQFDPYRNMQFGKRVSANDACLVIRNIPYESNVVYQMYDDAVTHLDSTDYYVVVNADSFYHVFKCLDNNRNGISNIEPNFAHISGSNTEVYQTSDGYRWKYMCSSASSVKDKFGTSEWFPFVANSEVQNAAVDGAIDIIKVEGTGSGYRNYLTGTFTGSHIRVGGNPRLYEIANSVVHQTNGFYTGCLLYLGTGTGSGQYATVSDYFSNSVGSFIVLDSEFSQVPTNGTTWELNPKVVVSGYGRTIVNAVARALVNTVASNSIFRVEVLNRGSGYQFASARVVANSVIGITSPAIVRPIKAPYGGHGYDAASDLGVTSIMFSVKFQNTESNTITSSNFFQQIGVIRDPIFGNTVFQVSSTNGMFIASETVHKINPKRCASNATINTSSSVVTDVDADFENQFSEGDYVYMQGSNGTVHMLSMVESVTNSSTMNLISNGFFACTETLVFQANVSSNAIFEVQSNSSMIHVSNVHGIFQSDDVFIGYQSGGFATISSVIRSGVEKTFNTFIQMVKLVGTLSSGTFTPNERVYQGSSLSTASATGILHSTRVDGGTLVLYITNPTGQFVPGQLIGTTSLAVASLNTIHSPEINEGSGEIMFLENIAPVNRQEDQSETVQINFSF